ncbi:hypothetical protein RBG11_004227 [Vibrio parahaemolyticus]|nr:hypothetical protein [Vibrio parahaemolyticus]
MTIKRAFSLKDGHVIGLLNEEIPLVRFRNSNKNNEVTCEFLATNEYANIKVKSLDTGLTNKIDNDKYQLKRNVIIYFGENVSILMSRYHGKDFRIVVETQDDSTVIFVQKGRHMNRTGKQDVPNENTYFLYDISESYQQRW